MPARTETIRGEIQKLVRQVPFRSFILNFENGQQAIIEHPENIAFDPATNGKGGSHEFHVVAGDTRLISTFDAVTSVALLDVGEAR
jgi:hypothetical protein